MKRRTLRETRRCPGQAWTVWLTGLSGAGKSTLARALRTQLKHLSLDCELIDGDEIREGLCSDLGFTQADREENTRRIAYLAQVLNRHGIPCIVAAISPYRAARDRARKSIPRFLEVHVDCPLPTLLKRDVKGLYQRALTGDLPNFTGISAPYEAPLSPDVYIDTGSDDENKALAAILSKLEVLNWVPLLETPQFL